MITVSVSVIIPVLNEAARVEVAIERAWDAGATEVIVVDGGSEDGTAELVKRAAKQAPGQAPEKDGCILVHSAAGRARQQNAGAAIARGEWLLFLHVDCWLDANAMTRAVYRLDRQIGRAHV